VSQVNFANHGDTADAKRTRANAVILARDDNFADALGGSALAVHQNAPPLVTPSRSLDHGVAAEISRVLAPGGTVYLLGGTAALSPAVADALTAMHFRVDRLAGTTRFESLIKFAPSIDLPAWDRRRDKDERDYDAWVPVERDGYVCLDRRFVRTAAHPQLEICDLLAPDDTFVLVKGAASACELSHLFMQAVTAVDALIAFADARATFAGLVDVHGRGRTIRTDFVP
jgi:hypothetical protein